MRPTLAADFFDWWMSSYRKKSRGSYGGNSLAGGGGVNGSIGVEPLRRRRSV